MAIPEHEGPPELYYNEVRSQNYDNNSRINYEQRRLTEKCIELLECNDNKGLILDIGCGSGISGDVLSKKNLSWIGVDISKEMLEINKDRNECNNKCIDTILLDMGEGLNFKPGTFSYVISVSAFQWLFFSNKKTEDPIRRIKIFFQTIFRLLKRGGKAVIQFYPKDQKQLELAKKISASEGFSGGIVEDGKGNHKKYYIVLETIKKTNKTKVKKVQTKREYIMLKKEIYRRRGKEVPKDSKYSGRRRK
ncbi:Methyltransferase [Spraguea lophii 42_110]|uniref:Methyltransferase n=1 Tax=Spraguea lophii (strain 42_110) TaxID=1358809 RepID=S7XK71_SPRLO|nr:Methyltransferase [Spraguea lophii 42_110]